MATAFEEADELTAYAKLRMHEMSEHGYVLLCATVNEYTCLSGPAAVGRDQ